MADEPSFPLRRAVEVATEEYALTTSLAEDRIFLTNTGTPLQLVQVGFHWRAIEFLSSGVRDFFAGNYLACAASMRSVFETLLFHNVLGHFPSEIDDFLLFSEVVGNPDFNREAWGVSNTKVDALVKQFGIRKMIKRVYDGTDVDKFYQQLSNAAHTSFEPMFMTSAPSADPKNSYSRLGIRRCVFSVARLSNEVNQVLQASYYHRAGLDDTLRRHAELDELWKASRHWDGLMQLDLAVIGMGHPLAVGRQNGKTVLINAALPQSDATPTT